MNIERRMHAVELVALEAQLLDEQAWDSWLALYQEDAQFWVPTWVSETRLTSDPACELSFMFLDGRKLLAERVHRITSGRSVASIPVPRTTHLVAGSVVSAGDGDDVTVKSAWSCHVYPPKEAALVTYTGRYEHELAWTPEGFRIARKKIILTNDQLQSKVDFFYL